MITIDTQTNTEHTDIRMSINLERGVTLSVELNYEQAEDMIFTLQNCLQEIDIQNQHASSVVDNASVF